MKLNAKRLIVLITAFISMVEVANAFYDPGLQRWINRDPIGEDGGANMYEFVFCDPVAENDPHGLDVCIVRSKGFPYHDWFVGENPDGTYWEVSFYPDNKKERGVMGRGKIKFLENSGFDPKKLSDDVKLVRYMNTSPEVDAKVRAEAIMRSESKDKPNFDIAGNNCQNFANGMYHFAGGSQMRENIIKKKNSKKPPESKSESK